MNIGIIANGIHCRFNDVDSHKTSDKTDIYIFRPCVSFYVPLPDYVHKMSSVVFMAVGENPSIISYYHLEKIFRLWFSFGNSDTLQCAYHQLILSLSIVNRRQNSDRMCDGEETDLYFAPLQYRKRRERVCVGEWKLTFVSLIRVDIEAYVNQKRFYD